MMHVTFENARFPFSVRKGGRRSMHSVTQLCELSILIVAIYTRTVLDEIFFVSRRF